MHNRSYLFTFFVHIAVHEAHRNVEVQLSDIQIEWETMEWTLK